MQQGEKGIIPFICVEMDTPSMTVNWKVFTVSLIIALFQNACKLIILLIGIITLVIAILT